MRHLKKYELFEHEELFEPDYIPFFTKKYAVWEGGNLLIVELINETETILEMKILYMLINNKIVDHDYKDSVELDKDKTKRERIKFESDDLKECKEKLVEIDRQQKYNL